MTKLLYIDPNSLFIYWQCWLWGNVLFSYLNLVIIITLLYIVQVSRLKREEYKVSRIAKREKRIPRIIKEIYQIPHTVTYMISVPEVGTRQIQVSHRMTIPVQSYDSNGNPSTSYQTKTLVDTKYVTFNTNKQISRQKVEYDIQVKTKREWNIFVDTWTEYDTQYKTKVLFEIKPVTRRKHRYWIWKNV